MAPFIGPYLDLAYTPATNTAWHWTAAPRLVRSSAWGRRVRWWSASTHSINRAVTIAGSWLGIAGGAWLIVGPSFTDLLNMSIGTPDPTSGTRRQALEQLSFFYAVGALTLFLAAAALGRLSVQSLRDVALAKRRVAQAETLRIQDQPRTRPRLWRQRTPKHRAR